MEKRNLDTTQSIFALVTGSLPSAVAVIRVSGEQAFPIAERFFVPSNETSFERKRGLFFGTWNDSSGNKVDEVVLLNFVGPHSFTGEDVIEIQCHGSTAVVSTVQKILVSAGSRPAEKGEFSYRALLNGRLTAAQVSQLGDVFLSKAPADLFRIYRRYDEAMSAQIFRMRDALITSQAILDTAVDFSEEYSAVIQQATGVVTQVTHECSSLIQRYQAFVSGAIERKLVLAGCPNSGKSSMFNALLCRYRAIVSEEPGTTRDVIEEPLEIQSRRWLLVDTAGVREAKQSIEAQGIELGENYLSSASAWILLVDGEVGLSAEDQKLLKKFASIPHLVVWNKSDLPNWKTPDDLPNVVSVSAKTGAGIEVLWERLNRLIESQVPEDQGPLPTATQVARLRQVEQELVEIRQALAENTPPEYISEKNRRAMDLLAGVMDEVTTEDVLDRIFREFCIGK